MEYDVHPSKSLRCESRFRLLDFERNESDDSENGICSETGEGEREVVILNDEKRSGNPNKT